MSIKITNVGEDLVKVYPWDSEAGKVSETGMAATLSPGIATVVAGPVFVEEVALREALATSDDPPAQEPATKTDPAPAP